MQAPLPDSPSHRACLLLGPPRHLRPGPPSPAPRSYSRGRYRHEIGAKKREQRSKRWRADLKEADELLARDHGRVSSPDAYLRHIQAVRQVWPQVWAEVLKLRWAKSRFLSLVAKEKALGKQFRTLCREGFDPARPLDRGTVFAIGNARFPATGRGEPGGAPGVKRLVELCRAHGVRHRMVDEFCTTQRCFDCQARTRDVWDVGWLVDEADRAVKPALAKRRARDALPLWVTAPAEFAWRVEEIGRPRRVGVGRSVRGLKYCPSSNCGFKDRDANAAKNILRKAVTPSHLGHRLLYLSRRYHRWEKTHFRDTNRPVQRWFKEEPFYLRREPKTTQELQAPYLWTAAALAAGMWPGQWY